jgi:hypothetical protein
MHSGFFATLPSFPTVDPEEADIAWLVYDLVKDPVTNRYQLTRTQTVYAKFEQALLRITTPQVGSIQTFVDYLQEKLEEKLEANPPDAPTLTDLL